jgi:hypothetical protein
MSKNNQREMGKNWSRVLDGCLTPRKTGRLTVSRNVTLTFTIYIYMLQYGDAGLVEQGLEAVSY